MRIFRKKLGLAFGLACLSVVTFLWQIPTALAMKFEKIDQLDKDDCHPGQD